MKWSAIITTYNSGSVIARALDSILALPRDESPVDIRIVDNHSSDDTLDVLSSYNGQIHLTANDSNLGLAAANNMAAENAMGDSLFFLNPDVELSPGAVTELHRFQETCPEAAILGPAMTDRHGEMQSTARTWPSPLLIASRRTSLGSTELGRKTIQKHMEAMDDQKNPVRTDWLVGAALWLTPLGRKTVGLMSDRYFLYFEDVEWCWRAWKRGMEVWYVPGAVIRHVCSRESTEGGSALKHHLRSMLRFYATHPSALFGSGPGGNR